MIALFYVAKFVVGFTGALVLLHHTVHGVISPLQISLALFCVINAMINLWEIALFVYIKRIKNRSDAHLKKLKPPELPSLFLLQEMNLCEALSLESWSEVWIFYSFFDESYADSKSFGWLIDVGNGVSSFLPSVLWAVCMTYHTILPAKVMAMIGIASFWQMLYGTILYFTQYMYHKRWEKHRNPTWQIVALVLGSNIVWIVFPALGIYTAAKIILTPDDQNGYAIFLD